MELIRKRDNKLKTEKVNAFIKKKKKSQILGFINIILLKKKLNKPSHIKWVCFLFNDSKCDPSIFVMLLLSKSNNSYYDWNI